MLYLVATPIGNLADLSLRAIETLKECDYLLCEDTRHSRILLDKFGIDRPMKSFHAWNESRLEEEVLADLQQGKIIGLLSDAGTPGICDPGEALVKRCWDEGIAIRALPGPSAWITALILSPMDKNRVQFLGFLPKTEGERKKSLLDALLYPGTSVFYETPHRIVESLQQIEKIDPKRDLCLLRELTKLYEEHRRGTAPDLLAHLAAHPPRGEYVVITAGCRLDFGGLAPREHVERLQSEFGVEKNEAIKLVASLRGIPKREVYF